jgi:hypothetical protein
MIVGLSYLFLVDSIFQSQISVTTEPRVYANFIFFSSYFGGHFRLPLENCLARKYYLIFSEAAYLSS